MPALALTGLALVLAATASFFSIVGLREFAPGAALAVTVLGATVEIAKLVLAAWLKSAWSTMPGWMRASGCAFVLLIMLLTALGTYAFLTAAHSAQAAGRDAASQAAQTAQDRLELHQRSLVEAQAEEKTIRAEYQAFLDAGKVSRAAGARQADADQLAEIRRRIERSQADIEKDQTDRAAAQQTLAGQAAELGPVMALASLIGGSETTAVNAFIFLLMAVFDPLAVFLSIAASHAAKRNKAKRQVVENGPAQTIAVASAIEAIRPVEIHQDGLVDAGAAELAAEKQRNKGGRPKGVKDTKPRKKKADEAMQSTASAALDFLRQRPDAA